MSEQINKKNILITLGVFIILGIGFFTNHRASVPQVGVFIPNEFWKVYSDADSGLKFQYPELSNKFIFAQEWPPKIKILPESFSCIENQSLDHDFITVVEKEINNSVYCIENQSEGAAGNVYTTYDYKTKINGDRALALTFVLKYPRCENYDEPNKSDCLIENENLNIDELADGILKSVVIK